MASPDVENSNIDITVPTRTRVFDTILAFFRRQLETGRLKAGDRLRPERELAELLNVSRPSLREALRAMELLGLVEIRHGQGAFMRAPEPAALTGFFGLVFAASPNLALGFVDLRIALECQAVRLACDHADDVDLQHIEAALARMPRSDSDGDLGAEADYEFHRAIVAASKNESLIFMCEAIAELLRQSHEERRAAVFGISGALDALAAAHVQIFDAIVARDGDRGVGAMREHFHRVKDYYEQLEGGHA